MVSVQFSASWLPLTINSVLQIGRSLLWVGALGLVILYIYSVGTFAFLPNEFHEPDPEEDGDNVRFCRSLAQCFISVLEYGLLDTLGLVSVMYAYCSVSMMVPLISRPQIYQ